MELLQVVFFLQSEGQLVVVAVSARGVAELTVHHYFIALSPEVVEDLVVGKSLLIASVLTEALVDLGGALQRLLVLEHLSL